jgi:hypothetical protein
MPARGHTGRAPWYALAATALVVAVTVGALLHHARDADPGSDARISLAVARQVAEGHGPVMPDGRLMTMRAPLWPLVLGGFMAVFGDPAGADVARVLVAVGVVLSIVALGRWWYGWWAGLLAALLALCAPPLLSVLSDWYADGASVAVALLALLLVDRAVTTRSTRIALGAGLAVAAAVLLKESAGFVAVAPFVAALARVDRDGWSWLRPAALTAFVATSAVTPWLVIHVAVEDRFFLTSIDGNAALAVLAGWLVVVALLGVAAARPLELAPRSRRFAVTAAVVVMLAWTAVAAVGLSGGLGFDAQGTRNTPWDIVDGYLLPAFGVPVLAVAGIVVLVVRTLRRERVALVHAAAFAAYLPLMVLWPLNGSVFVARNALVGVLLVHVAAGEAVVVAIDRLARVLRSPHHPTRRLAAFGLAIVVLASCSWAAVDGVRAKPARPVAQARDLDALSAWVQRNVPRGTTIMGSYLDWTWLSRATGDRYRVVLAPWTHLALAHSQPPFRPIRVVPVTGDPATEPVRDYGTDWLAVRRSDTKGYLLGLSQTALIDALRSTHSRYLVITGGSVFAATAIVPTLRRIGGIEQVRWFGHTVVMRVDPEHLVPLHDPPLWTDASTRAWLRREHR